MQHSEQKPLFKQIHLYKKKYYTNTLIKGILTAISLLLAGFTFVTAFEYFAQMNSDGRTFLFFAYLSMLVLCIYFWIGVPTYKLIFLDRFLNDEEASKKIGIHFPDIKDKLLNTLQLQKTSTSNTLAAASISYREHTLSKYEFHKAIDLSENRKHARFIIIFLGIIGVALLIKPAIVLESSNRILNYKEEFLPFDFNLLNDNLNVNKNGDVTVKVELTGESIPAEVYISDGNMRRKMRSNENTFEFTFERIQQEKSIHFEANGYESKSFKISIINQPEVVESNIELQYPNYLNINNKKVSNTNFISVPEGTKINWKLLTESASKLIIDSKSNKPEQKSISRNNVMFSKTFKASQSVDLELTNEQNGLNKKLNFQVNVIKDQFPKINFEQYKDTILFNYLVVGGTAIDDYGIRALSINYSVQEENKQIKVGKIRLPVGKGNTQNFTHQFLLDSLLKKPGQQLTYYITAWDNDGINGSKSTKTKTYTFELPSKKDLRKSLNESSEKTESQMSNSMKKIEEVKKKSSELDKNLRSKKNTDWNDKQNMEDLLEEHKKLEKELNKLSEQFKEQIEKESRFDKPDEKDLQKMKQLQKMMDELLDDETKKLLQELQELMQQQMNKEELQKMMEEINKKDELMDKELDRIMELFKELQFEQKMDETIKDLEELAKKQQELAEKTKDKKEDNNKLLEEQEKLNEEFKDLQEELDKLKEMNEELENPKSMENTESQENSINKEQEKSKESLSENKNKKASESQQDAAQKMQEMADKMKESQSGMEAEAVEENIDDLRQILNNLVIVSKDQEKLMEEFRTVNQADPRYVELSQDQLKIREDVQIIEDSLYALSKRVFQLESFITKEVAELNDHLDNASEVLKARRPREATKDQQYAMTSMNNLALLLDDVLDQLQQEMQQMMSDKNCSGGNCKKKKPGSSNNPGKKPGSLSELQKSLNQKIQQLKDGQKNGRSMSKELAESAAQQEMIRRALEEMKKELEAGGNKAGGDLDKLSELMEETEKDIVNKNITQETIERQKQIQTRLLEAEKSKRERDFEEKRESQTAKEINRELPPEVEKYIKERQKQIELLKTVPPSLHPYYKKKVMQYFEKIENYSQNY